MQKNSHCSYCGRLFEPAQPWPRLCPGCGQISYLNPLPVAVTLLPVSGGLLAVRRAIPPHLGHLALPGGYINLGETWQQAAAREVQEETGVPLVPQELLLFDVQSAPDSTLLIFALAQPHRLVQNGRLSPAGDAADPRNSQTHACIDLPGFQGDGEAGGVCVITDPALLAWELHRQAAEKYFHGA